MLVGVAMSLMSVYPATAEERVISFTKDIDLVPSNSDAASRIRVKLDVDRQRADRGEMVTISFQTDQDCYLTLVDFGTSGKITQLWPNQFSGPDAFIRANQRYTFPSATDRFRFRVSGPDGVERIVALATTQKNRILKESDFSDYTNGFRSYTKGLKDLIVEASQATSAMNKDDRWGTGAARIVIGKGSPGGSITSRNVYVLSVGAATGKLRYCEDDAQRFAQMISDRVKVPAENVRVLTGRKATREGFVDGLGWLARQTNPEDLVFVYFSGHGTQIPDRLPLDEPDGLDEAFVCYHEKGDLSLDDPQLGSALLVDDDFEALSLRIPARRRILVVDSCHSGSINKDVSGRLISKYLPLVPPSMLKELKVEPTRTSNRIGFGDVAAARDTVAAACEEAESSFEDRSKQGGLFTYWFIKSMQEGAHNLKQAFEAAQSKVLDDTSAAGVKQSPKLNDQTGLSRDVTF